MKPIVEGVGVAAVTIADRLRRQLARLFRGGRGSGWPSFIALILTLTAVGAPPVPAQASASPAPERRISETLHSSILGEDRQLEIYLPDGYDPSTPSRYDVICTVKGGGLSGQAGAVKHGISQALTKYEPVPVSYTHLTLPTKRIV